MKKKWHRLSADDGNNLGDIKSQDPLKCGQEVVVDIIGFYSD